MTLVGRIFRGMVPALFAFALCMGAASAQSNKSGCALEPVGGTSRQLLRCQGGLTIIAESGARYSLVDRNRDGRTDAAKLQSKALLLDFAAGSSGTGFQVSTPQAIAAVRGTKWAVDVAAGKTSVFVVRGAVAVQRPAGGAGVVLNPGDGVDVEQGTGALTVKRWPKARVSALMARFGQ
jgi:ferric-dicitrate binding protein FerR (iron transport regulator)